MIINTRMCILDVHILILLIMEMLLWILVSSQHFDQMALDKYCEASDTVVHDVCFPRPVWTASTVASLWSTYGSECSTSLSTAMSSSVHTVGTWTTILWSHSPPSKFLKLIDESFALVIAILLILLLYYISFIGEHSVTLISFLI